MEILLDQLARISGVFPEYYDIWGKKHETSADTKKKILGAMGYDVSSAEALTAQIRENTRPRFLEPVIVLNILETDKMQIPVSLPYVTEVNFDMEIEDEAGGVQKFSFSAVPVKTFEFEGINFGRFRLDPEGFRGILPGYYGVFLTARFGEQMRTGSMRLIVSPGISYIPPGLKKTWGMTIALYGIRSGRNWGIGDFGDLGEIMKWTSALGGDFTGILPLHALPLPHGISPYSPISRLYKNFLFLDLEQVPEFALIEQEIPRTKIERLRENEFVDYEGVYWLKLEALKKMFNHFYKADYRNPDSGRGEDFDLYLREEGKDLLHFGAFMALWEENQKGWKDWLGELQDPESGGVVQYIEKNREKVLFHAYTQWLIDNQLSVLSGKCEELGLRSGLYSDLAIGSLGGGADAWLYQNEFAFGADVGAPPDEFNLNGQNWGFPPLIPQRMRESGYDMFIKTIRKNLKHCGMLRIDHALGLFRLFWVPEGMKPSEGAYVRYPSDDLLGIIALESQRGKAAIVAEDLGTVPPEVHAGLARHKMLSYRLFYYERRYPDPSFIPPQDYPEQAFAAVTTHDLPTIYGFWEGRDIEIKKELAIYPSEELYEKDVSARRRDKELIIKTLIENGLLPGDYLMPDHMDRKLLLAIYGFLAKAPSLYIAMSLDDWLGVPDQENMPGTIRGYPNWKQKTPFKLEEFTKTGSLLKELFSSYGRGR